MDNSRSGHPYSVVVIGAGLSGLMTARELTAAGIEDIVILEARDRIGGRLHEQLRPNGMPLQAGGEFTGPQAKQMRALAEELGIAVEPLAPFANGFENMGLLVRVFNGKRIVEPYPFAEDEDAGAAYAAATATIDEMVSHIDYEAPWDAERAHEWDHQSFGQWLDANVTSPAARHMIEVDLWTFVDLHDVSLLYILWFLAGYGGWEGYGNMHDCFAGGTAQIPRRLAEKLGDHIRLSCPVRRIEQRDDVVLVHHDDGITQAAAVVVAMDCGQTSKIEYEPRLPAARDLLQARWQGVGAVKFFAVYDRPFWRDEGLAGVAFGPFPVPVAFDITPPGSDQGILVSAFTASGAAAGQYGDDFRDPVKARGLVLDHFAMYFGEAARNPVEFYHFDWTSDPWTTGAGTVLPLGLLTSVGRSLRKPVGRIVWAGSDNGEKEWMEGAVSSASRAAREVQALLAERPVPHIERGTK